MCTGNIKCVFRVKPPFSNDPWASLVENYSIFFPVNLNGCGEADNSRDALFCVLHFDFVLRGVMLIILLHVVSHFKLQ